MLHHHERYDGSGYPACLRAAEIPLESRIIAVADAYEAMTGDRPYRDGCLPRRRALDELRKNVGTSSTAAASTPSSRRSRRTP